LRSSGICASELQHAYKGELDAQIPQVRISAAIPKAVRLGYHLCFGTLGGWPRFAPDDLGAAVKLANAYIEGSGRGVDWMHIPVLDRSDDAFFAPLRELRPQVPQELRRGRLLRLWPHAARGASARA
jgi:hypothetical protein